MDVSSKITRLVDDHHPHVEIVHFRALKLEGDVQRKAAAFTKWAQKRGLRIRPTRDSPERVDLTVQLDDDVTESVAQAVSQLTASGVLALEPSVTSLLFECEDVPALSDLYRVRGTDTIISLAHIFPELTKLDLVRFAPVGPGVLPCVFERFPRLSKLMTHLSYLELPEDQDVAAMFDAVARKPEAIVLLVVMAPEGDEAPDAFNKIREFIAHTAAAWQARVPSSVVQSQGEWGATSKTPDGRFSLDVFSV